MPDVQTDPSPRRSWLAIPEVPRVLPLAVFLVLTSLAPGLFPGSEYWLYALKTLAVAAMVIWLKPYVPEMKWAVSGTAIAVGVGVAGLWLALEGRVPTLSQLSGWALSGFKSMPAATPPPPWNPLAYFSSSPVLAWGFVVLRVLGRSWLVPQIEEVFYRGFVYRYVIQKNFLEVPLKTWNPLAFFLTSGLFGLVHPDQWCAGVLCGMAYQGLVIRSGRLGDAMTAHAVTNLLLSGWAIATRQWQFT